VKISMLGLSLVLSLVLTAPLSAFFGGCSCVGEVWKLVPQHAPVVNKGVHTQRVYHGGNRLKRPDPTPVPGSDGYVFTNAYPGTTPKSALKPVNLPFGTTVRVVKQYKFYDSYGREGYPIDELEVLSGKKKGKHVFLGDQDVMMMNLAYKSSVTGVYPVMH